MWSKLIVQRKAEYFDIFHSDKPQYMKDKLLKNLHEEIGRLDDENQKLWIMSGAKPGDIDTVVKYWKGQNGHR